MRTLTFQIYDYGVLVPTCLNLWNIPQSREMINSTDNIIRYTSTPPQDLIEELQEEQERLERDRIKKEKLRVLMAQPRRISSRLEVKQ